MSYISNASIIQVFFINVLCENRKIIISLLKFSRKLVEKISINLYLSRTRNIKVNLTANNIFLQAHLQQIILKT